MTDTLYFTPSVTLTSDLIPLIRQARTEINTSGKVLLVYLLGKLRDTGLTTEDHRREYAAASIQLLENKLDRLSVTINYGKITGGTIDRITKLSQKIVKVPAIPGYTDLSTAERDRFCYKCLKVFLDAKTKMSKDGMELNPTESRFDSIKFDGSKWEIELVTAILDVAFAFEDLRQRNPRYCGILAKKIREFIESPNTVEQSLACRYKKTINTF